ncbi:Fic/DOC family protein [Leifsonia shinshuensis]|uniref:Fic/DOC family protein n=1 Tax=Leifsonia shinshuensis TaxID=150026 RepID=UPI0035E9C8B6
MTDSKYCYPGTDVLINKFNIQEKEELERIERIYTTKRLGELELKPISDTFDLKHLQKIHHHMFKDLYDWAGKTRDVEISKADAPFAPAAQIKGYSDHIFTELKREQFLKGMDIRQFSERVAYFLGEINALHPFREGNGRAQREFVRNLAEKNGFSLSWDKVERKEFIRASEVSFLRGDNQPFANILEKNIENREPDKALMRSYEERFLER